MKDLQIPLFEALENKELGMARVGVKAGPSFTAAVMVVIDKIASGTVFRFEEVRFRCAEAGVEAHKPQAWGRMATIAVNKGLLRPTGARSAMRGTLSNARITPEYYRTNVPYDA